MHRSKQHRLFDHLVGAGEQRGGTVRPSALAVLRLIDHFELGRRLCTGRSAGFAPLRMRLTLLPVLLTRGVGQPQRRNL